MRRTRFMSLMFLALALAFFCVREFRWGLGLPLMERRFVSDQLIDIAPAKLRALAARSPDDPQALAFVALHLVYADPQAAYDLAGQAVSRDPSLTWIYYDLALSVRGASAERRWLNPQVAQRVQASLPKLEAWDPENAVPFLLEAEFLRATAKDQPWPLISPSSHLDFPLQHPEWTAAMERAFQRSRYDAYHIRRFELERKLLTQQGWATPATVLMTVASFPIPNLLNLREYANFLVYYQGKNAEKAGRLDEALRDYNAASRFGLHMRGGPQTTIEDLIGVALDKIASQPLHDALVKAKRPDEAALVALRLEQYERIKSDQRDRVGVHSNAMWDGILIYVCSGLIVLFGALTLLSVLYVNLKRWIRRDQRGFLYRLFTTLENYAPILLFFSCLELFLVYTPYAANFHYYMAADTPVRNLEPVLHNTYPLLLMPSWWWGDIAPGNPFSQYQWWALGILVVTVVLAWWDARAARPAQAGAPGAAAGK